MSEKHNLKALTSLALLSSEIIPKDYLSVFLPFVATLAVKKQYEEINIATIAADFNEEY